MAVVSLAVGLQAVVRPPAIIVGWVVSWALTVLAWVIWLGEATNTTPGHRLDSGQGKWATYGFILLGGGVTLLVGVTTVALFISALLAEKKPVGSSP